MRDVIWRKWLVWALAPLYALLFGEIFVRCLAPVPLIPRYVTGAPYGVRVGMPNMKFWQTTSETRIQIRTNSRGIRADREYAYEKPPGVCRIVVFGDSLFVGYEVNLEDSFVYLLERKLNEAGYRCEVINLAVSGFGTAEMLVTLHEEGLKYHPDVVLFSSHTTDLDDNVRSSLYTLNDYGHLIRKNASYLPGIRLSDELSKFSLYTWLVESSQLYSALRERTAKTVKDALVNGKKPEGTFNGPDGEMRRPGEPANPADEFAQLLNLKLMEEAKRVSEANRAHFCVLEIPFSLSRTEIARLLPEYGEDVIEKLHILNPLARLRAALSPFHKVYFEKGHWHLTPLGNRVLADYFFGEIVRTGWIEQWKK
jgi:hypothetical protein